MRPFILILALAFSLPPIAHSDIKGINQLRFDANSDGEIEAILTQNGLGLGTNNPSANLHVHGKAIFSENISIGTTTSPSTFNISGTVSKISSTLSSNTTLSNSSMVFADTSTGNIYLQLPSHENTSNRTYFIKKTNPNNSLHIRGSFIDSFTELTFGPSSDIYPYLELIAGSGNQWYITDISGNTQAIGSSNLIAWYPLNEVSGNISVDYGTTQLNGVITNIASDNVGVAGKLDQAIYFDGVDDEVIIQNHSSFDSITTELTVCFWVKDEAQGANSGYISKEIDSGAGWGIEDDRFFIWASGGNADNSYDDIDDNEWHHMAYTWDGTTSNIYKDGALFDTLVDGSGTISTNNDPLTLGYTKLTSNNVNRFTGNLDDVRVYNSALSASEIQLIYSTSR